MQGEDVGRYQSYDDVRAVCPFYTGTTPIEVRCEGVGGGTCVIVRFANGRLRNEYRARYCDNMKGYESCPIARAHEM